MADASNIIIKVQILNNALTEFLTELTKLPDEVNELKIGSWDDFVYETDVAEFIRARLLRMSAQMKRRIDQE